MSRIDSALEKASLMRQSIGEKIRVNAPRPAPALSRLRPPALDSTRVSNPFLVTANNPHTPIAEEYRKLKSEIVKMTKKNSHNALMVTSCLCSEGKSITSLNLAISLAQEYDHTVLLIDADLRKPSLHTYLGIEPASGLSECITEGADIGKSIIETGIGKLSLLPAGKSIKSPVELFSSQNVRELFMEMKNRYPDRYIIIDAPPVLPFTDSRTLSTLVDGVILVVKEGIVTINDINDAIGYLKGPSLLGIVYNQADIETRSGHYSYY